MGLYHVRSTNGKRIMFDFLIILYFLSFTFIHHRICLTVQGRDFFNVEITDYH